MSYLECESSLSLTPSAPGGMLSFVLSRNHYPTCRKFLEIYDSMNYHPCRFGLMIKNFSGAIKVMIRARKIVEEKLALPQHSVALPDSKIGWGDESTVCFGTLAHNSIKQPTREGSMFYHVRIKF